MFGEHGLRDLGLQSTVGCSFGYNASRHGLPKCAYVFLLVAAPGCHMTLDDNETPASHQVISATQTAGLLPLFDTTTG